MAMYICFECGNFKDDDWCVGTEHPTQPLELICEDCACEIDEEEEENG